MYIEPEKFAQLVENIMVILKFDTDLGYELEDLTGHLAVVRTAVDNLQDILTELMFTPGPAHALSHPAPQSPGPAQGPDQSKAGSQDKEPRQSDPS